MGTVCFGETSVAAGGAEVLEIQGLGYAPLSGDWHRTASSAVNYLAFASKS